MVPGTWRRLIIPITVPQDAPEDSRHTLVFKFVNEERQAIGQEILIVVAVSGSLNASLSRSMIQQ